MFDTIMADKMHIMRDHSIRESPSQFEYRIMTRMYIHSAMNQKSSVLLAGTGVWKISSVAYGFSSIRFDSINMIIIKV